MKNRIHRHNIEGSVTFPQLRGLMAKHDVSFDALADVMGARSARTVEDRLASCKISVEDMIRLLSFFKSLGEPVTSDALFSDWRMNGHTTVGTSTLVPSSPLCSCDYP